MNKALGAVYGAFIGDAAGGYLEFWRQGLIT
jgi:ADP-ribosylglycohydrolase